MEWTVPVFAWLSDTIKLNLQATPGMSRGRVRLYTMCDISGSDSFAWRYVMKLAANHSDLPMV